MSWYGILYLSECGEIAQPFQPARPTPLPLLQCNELLGKKFYSIANDGENMVVCCMDGNFIVYPNGNLEPLRYEPLLVHVSTGEGFSVGITESGQLYSWGYKGESGQLGHGANLKKVFQPLEINFRNLFTRVQCGKAFSVALDDRGQAYAWGENFDRQLGIYNKPKNSMHLPNAMVEEMVFSPRLIPLSLKIPFVRVACGERFTLAITKDGQLFSWGAGESGQLGTGRCSKRDVPAKVTFDSSDSIRVIDVACGDGHVIALLEDKNIYSWGLNHRGQCGLNDTKARQHPERIRQSIGGTKLFANIHSSAAIDESGSLWTWGSTRNGRLLHTVEEVQVHGEHQRVTGCVSTPTKYISSQFKDSKFECFCFAKSRVGILVKTTLTKVWPMKGPKRTFSRLYIHGFGLWKAEQIIVKFSSKVPSIYNPPRSCMAKLMEPGVIVCKPPKFAEVGIYSVEVSMDGGKEFLAQSFEILIYKEVLVAQQVPAVIDLRHQSIPQLIIKAQGSPTVLDSNLEYLSIKQHNEIQGMKFSAEETADMATVKLLFREISANDEKDHDKQKIQLISKSSVKFEVCNMSVSTDSENNEKMADGQLIVQCDNIDLSQIDDLSQGLYEVFCQLSFNDQDFPPLTKEAIFSICHSFSPVAASPCSYLIGELNRLVEVYHRQENNQVDSFEALQEFIDYHIFERKVIVTGQSLFPSNKLQKGSHIMAVVSKCTVSSLSGEPGVADVVVDGAALDGLEELLVHGDSTTVMHFNLNSAYLRQVQSLIMQLSQDLKFSVDDVIVKVYFVFQIETPSINGMEKVLLSDQSVPFFFFPSMRPSLSKSFYYRSGEQHAVSILREDGSGFPFNPTSAVVRLHAMIDDANKVVYVIPSEKTIIREIKNNNDANGSTINEFINDTTSLPKKAFYVVDTFIPSFDELFQYSKSQCPAIQANISTFLRTTFLSLSLDGLSIPQEQEWRKISYYSKDLVKYSLQSPVPKGGAPPGSQIHVVLGESIPLELNEFVRVRLRGSDTSVATQSLTVHLAEHISTEGGDPGVILTFNVPDAATLAQVPPTMNGKEKLYYVDISVDGGESFETAASPLLQVK